MIQIIHPTSSALLRLLSFYSGAVSKIRLPTTPVALTALVCLTISSLAAYANAWFKGSMDKTAKISTVATPPQKERVEAVVITGQTHYRS